jgi:putative FmdB family regulatory protein
MPTYEFRCPLGHEFERFYRTISAAEPETPCPTCGQMAARQMSGGAGLLFKGSGFYLTDYGKDAHRKKAPSDGSGEGAKKESAGSEKSSGGESSAGGGAGGGDAKPAEKKAESKPAAKPGGE